MIGIGDFGLLCTTVMCFLYITTVRITIVTYRFDFGLLWKRYVIAIYPSCSLLKKYCASVLFFD